MKYIHREITSQILEAHRFYSVIVITGPRQVGKTTLCKNLWPEYKYFNLDDHAFRAMVKEDPKKFVYDSGEHVIIDEVQNLPDLFSYIQLCVDEYPYRRFILTGSNNFSLMENITQSMAGRAALFTLLPFSFKEVSSYVDESSIDTLLYRGFYPGVIVRGFPPTMFYSNYYSTYLERDLRQIKAIENLDAFQMFMKVIAGRVSTEFNASSISSVTGISSPTVKSWLGVLKTSYIAFSLMPFYSNIEKRLTKTPKIYFYDTGLLCFLLGINNISQLDTHPLRGAIFENLAVSEFIKRRNNTGSLSEIYFYRENRGHEVDVVIKVNESYYLYEIKSSKTFNSSFSKNLKYLSSLLGEAVKKAEVVYDGDTFSGVAVNIRRI